MNGHYVLDTYICFPLVSSRITNHEVTWRTIGTYWDLGREGLGKENNAIQ